KPLQRFSLPLVRRQSLPVDGKTMREFGADCGDLPRTARLVDHGIEVLLGVPRETQSQHGLPCAGFPVKKKCSRFENQHFAQTRKVCFSADEVFRSVVGKIDGSMQTGEALKALPLLQPCDGLPQAGFLVRTSINVVPGA